MMTLPMARSAASRSGTDYLLLVLQDKERKQNEKRLTVTLRRQAAMANMKLRLECVIVVSSVGLGVGHKERTNLWYDSKHLR